MITIEQPTLTELWHNVIQRCLYNPDHVDASGSYVFDWMSTCSSMDFDLDLGRDLWLDEKRFSRLQNDYIDLGALHTFLSRCRRLRPGMTAIASMPAKWRDLRHSWGGCILGWTFRLDPFDGLPRLSMHSRTSYVAYIGGLDLALSWVLAREIGEGFGEEPGAFRFTWVLDKADLNFTKSLPLLLTKWVDPHFVLDNLPHLYPAVAGVQAVRKQLNDFSSAGVPMDDETWAQFKRVRRRYEEWKRGEVMSGPQVWELTLDAVRTR